MVDALTSWLDTLPDTARYEAEVRLRGLVKLLFERRLRFLFGAGMSAKSGMPVASKLSETLLTDMFLPHSGLAALVNLYPVDAIAEAYAKKTDEASLFRMVTTIYDRKVDLHEGHLALQYLADQGFIERVYTTNFDTLLEKAFSERGSTITDSNIDHLRTAEDENRVPVLHLHGAVGLAPKIVESEMFELDTALGRLLTADMTIYWFAWVGYSMTDMDIRHLFFATRRAMQLQRAGKSPFVIYPLSTIDKELEWRVADQLWRARSCLFIPGAAELVLPAVVTLLGRVQADAIVIRILTKLGRNATNPDEIRDIWDKAEKLAADGLGTAEEALRVLAEQYGVAE
jgi:hypothetical protein